MATTAKKKLPKKIAKVIRFFFLNLAMPISLLALVLSPFFFQISTLNGLVQVWIFCLCACFPAYFTGRMSYVDIAWPFGLVAIGIVVALADQGYWLRNTVVGSLYILAGLRMAIPATAMLFAKKFRKEFPRYAYQRIRWQKAGVKKVKFTMQKEILMQALANMSTLFLPGVLVVANETVGFHFLEYLGLVLWGVFLVLETIADMQKDRFLKECKAKGKLNQVCKVGLWKFTRHPNYFSEWMVWNALFILALPSYTQLWFLNEPLVVLLGLTVGYFAIPLIMYHCLVHFTGARPAEYYSLKKRPGYKAYQAAVPMFFPRLPKAGRAGNFNGFTIK